MDVYALIIKLCSELVKENDCEELSIKAAKKIAFENLLKKSFDKSFNDCEKVLKELQFIQFELSLSKRTEDIESIDSYIELFKSNSNELHSITALLCSLKNFESKPAFFSEPHSFLQLQPKTLHDIKRNKYLSNIRFTSIAQNIQHSSNSKNRPEERLTFLSSILDAYSGNERKEEPIENLKLKPLKQMTNSSCSQADSDASPLKPKRINTWENVGELEDSPLKPFCIESSSPFIYQRLKLSKKSNSATSSEITVVSLPKLLNDIKLLMIGIESETFKRSEALKFYIKIRVCCENISSLENMLDKFLEMGTCFTRLKSYTAKNPFNQNQIFEGFIFKAFCDRVIKFLNYSRDIIYAQDVETILQLSRNTSTIMKIVIHLSKFLNIHPSSLLPLKRAIPSGSEFLRLLYNEYTHVLDSNIKLFYIDLLKACCDVYYVRYQEWLYHGKLDDPYKELFVYFVDRYKENTKHFFDRAYLIRKQSVPDFLVNCVDNVLLCGKYTILLKSFNPLHPLFVIRKPPLRVCLTFDQVNELKQHCQDFISRARQECGEAISIAEIMEEKRRVKLEKYKNAEIASTKNALKWKQFQEEHLKEIREFREAQQKELRKELEIIEEKRLLKMMSEIQAERDYLDEIDTIEDEELLRENEMLKARVKIYQELNSKLSEELKEQDDIVMDLKQSQKTVQNDINANKPVIREPKILKDEMNNLLESTATATSQTLTQAQRNKIKVMSHEYNFLDVNLKDESDGINNNNNKSSLTDAQKNRMKVLGHEFGMIDESKAVSPKIKVQDYDTMTDLQKNRLKVLSHEFGIADEKGDDNKNKKEKSQRNTVMTELQRNRRKVLSHEFGYECIERNVKSEAPEKPRLSLEFLNPTEQVLESPMSTTSDHFNIESHESKESPERTLVENEGHEVDDEDLFKAFEEAIEINQSKFWGMKLNDSSDTATSKGSCIKKTDIMALSSFLEMSFTLPLNSYMEVLNNETLKMYVKDLNILTHFKSLRNYFLLMNGEFCSCICHDIFSKIESGARPVDLLNYQSLHMILDQALSSSRYYDFNTENLSFIVQNIPEKFELHSPSILSMLTLSYQLDWPLSLILNPETMDKYRAIFNYLIKLKRITWVLEQCFQILKESHKQHGMDILKSQQYRNVQHIRHMMTQFVNSLENYVTRNVIQISWNGFIEDIKSAESILCIYRKHANYLKRILFLCLLNKSYTEFYKNIEDIFKVILKFYKHLKSGKWQFSSTSSAYTHDKYNKMQVDSDEFHRLIRYVLYLGNKVIQQGYQKEIYDLLNLIDVNGYYSSSN